jgi:trimeric autotransporter adhesin
MNYSRIISAGLAIAAAFAVMSARAQQPPDPVTSDSRGNTALGSYALIDLGNSTLASANTALGDSALYENTSGGDNTAVGYGALADNTTGSGNTAIGAATLQSNGAGVENTGIGVSALQSNTTGGFNTAVGSLTLNINTTGTSNTAVGSGALAQNESGSYNTAIGASASQINMTGSYTTAVGALALLNNSTGGYDTAFGAYALNLNTTGSGNTAFGYAALRSTTSGNSNIGFGYQSLYQDATGSNNIAMGYQAAYNLYNGSNTIEIGNLGGPGDTNLTRIGTQGVQTNAYIAGIAGAQVTGAAVYVTSSGQLGVLASSERYKTSISSMGESTTKLQKLRPVTFLLKTDPKRVTQYGLVAEEVYKVYPELVIRDSAGKIEGVRYEELTPMLLNEVQKQAGEIQEMKAQLTQLDDLKRELQTALRRLKSPDSLIARR